MNNVNVLKVILKFLNNKIFLEAAKELFLWYEKCKVNSDDKVQ